MSRRQRETEPVLSGGSLGFDGLYSVGGGGTGIGSPTETQNSGGGTGGSYRGDEGGIPKTSWFAPITDFDSEFINSEVEFGVCKDGVCPVPWETKTVVDDNYLTTAQIPNFDFITIDGRPKVKEDTVNHPSHYTDGGIETIEAIEAQLSTEEYEGYLRGNCVKYLWRWRHKGGVEDLKKCKWYLDRLISLIDV